MGWGPSRLVLESWAKVMAKWSPSRPFPPTHKTSPAAAAGSTTREVPQAAACPPFP